jgi:hypothetical protein
MRRRHAVADEEDHVARLAGPRRVDLPAHGPRDFPVARDDRVPAGFRERDVAQDQGRGGHPVLALDEHGRPADRRGQVRAVDRDLGVRSGHDTVELDLEIEA